MSDAVERAAVAQVFEDHQPANTAGMAGHSRPHFWMCTCGTYGHEGNGHREHLIGSVADLLVPDRRDLPAGVGEELVAALMVKWDCGPGADLMGELPDPATGDAMPAPVARLCRSTAHTQAYWGRHCGFAGDAAASALVVFRNAAHPAQPKPAAEGSMPTCTDPECPIYARHRAKRQTFPPHGPHDFRAALAIGTATQGGGDSASS